MSNTIENLLSVIGDINDTISTRRWYFSGAKTYKIIHGKSDITTVFEDTDGVPAKYDQQDADTLTGDMFYDPRYRTGYAKEYNQTYTNYVISINDESKYYAMNLKSAMSDQNVIYVLAGYDTNDTAAHASLRKIIAAATVMNKLDIIYAIDTNYKSYIDKYLSNSENSSAVDKIKSTLRNHFGLSSGELFNSYEAGIDESACWYVSDEEKAYLNQFVEEYKEAVDKLYDLAEKAAENGGTIINCINYNKPTIANNKYSYINISQIMVCVNSSRTTTASDLDELIDEYIKNESDELTKENRKKIIIISIIIAIAILFVSTIIMVSFKIWSASKIERNVVVKSTKG